MLVLRDLLDEWSMAASQANPRQRVGGAQKEKASRLTHPALDMTGYHSAGADLLSVVTVDALSPLSVNWRLRWQPRSLCLRQSFLHHLRLPHGDGLSANQMFRFRGGRLWKMSLREWVGASCSCYPQNSGDLSVSNVAGTGRLDQPNRSKRNLTSMIVRSSPGRSRR